MPGSEYHLNTETDMVEKVTTQETTIVIDVSALTEEKSQNLQRIAAYNDAIAIATARNTDIDADIAMDAMVRAEA